ncbi:hypothetical protein RR48_08172 [Papilio machaon]|uniref:Zinc finger C3HC4 RING-type domain-containing protein n=1 Tax=Papilio machaon TaxID=76193 RepID=A0A194RF09_PAPMA|nr:hypothetical protein RR48_08172 [Papilio machaon]
MAEQQAVPDPRHPEAPRPPGLPLVVDDFNEIVPYKGNSRWFSRDNHFYVVSRSRGASTTMRCASDRCPAHWILRNGIAGPTIGQHNHSPTPWVLNRNTMFQELKRRASEESIPLNAIYEEEAARYPDAASHLLYESCPVSKSYAAIFGFRKRRKKIKRDVLTQKFAVSASRLEAYRRGEPLARRNRERLYIRTTVLRNNTRALEQGVISIREFLVQTSRLLDVGVEAVVDNVPEFAQEVVIADNIEQVAPEVVQAPILEPADVLPASPPRHDNDREPQPLRCNICATNPLEVVLIPCGHTQCQPCGGNASEDFAFSHFHSLELAGTGGPASSH